MTILADFHIHSCLSPCGDLEMSPSVIARKLAEKGVALAALTDHNSALNCPAFAVSCRKFGVLPLFGMEVQTAEEIHVLALFSSCQTALDFGAELYETLPPVLNDPEKTGDQVYVDADENILGEVEKYLITSVSLSIDEIGARIHGLGGLCIPAHVDRPAFSLVSQFGYVPAAKDWDALEFVCPRNPVPTEAGMAPPSSLGLPVITSSDAHYPEHISRRAFTLDIGDLPLTGPDGAVSLDTVRAALKRLT